MNVSGKGPQKNAGHRPGRTAWPAVVVAVWLAAWLATWLARPAAAGVSVVVPPENTVTGARIILGDIATVAPDSEEDAALAQLAEAIDLGPAPEPGRETVLRRRQLEQRLAASGAPVSDIRWLIPDEVKLTSAGRTVNDDLVKSIILEHLNRTEPYATGLFEILSLTLSTPPPLPPGQVEYRFAPQPSSNPNYLTGAIFFSVDGHEAGRLRATVQIDLRVAALVATRDLSRGHVLSEEDVSESTVPYAQAKGALTEVDQAVGQTLKTNARTGAPIRARDLELTHMVKKGEIVTIVAQSGGLRVTALGQARQDGALGQTITVTNQDSKKTISAKVVGDGLVEVIF
jgi:flagella basal body P-ring formation protein FlgA